MKIKLNPDQKIVEQVQTLVQKKNGHCPCALVQTHETLCPCVEFRESDKLGACRCGLFIKE